MDRLVLKKVPGSEVRSNVTTTYEPSKRANYPFAEAWVEDTDAPDWRSIADHLANALEAAAQLLTVSDGFKRNCRPLVEYREAAKVTD